MPRQGDLLDDGQLWRVDAVVFGTGIDVYTTRLSDDLAEPTRKAWETWGDTAAETEPAANQGRLFGQ